MRAGNPGDEKEASLLLVELHDGVEPDLLGALYAEVMEMSGEDRKSLEERLRKLRAELEERKSSIPAHSIRPHQLIEIEELEEAIQDLEKKLERS